MKTIDAIWAFWVSHGTKVIAFVQGTIAAVAAVDGIIPASHLKYYMAILAVLTFWRGFFNSSQQRDVLPAPVVQPPRAP